MSAEGRIAPARRPCGHKCIMENLVKDDFAKFPLGMPPQECMNLILLGNSKIVAVLLRRIIMVFFSMADQASKDAKIISS